MWANIMSAATCGGKELDYVKEYLPNSYSTFLKIMKELKQNVIADFNCFVVNFLTQYHFYSGGLPRAVAAEKCEHLTIFYSEAQVVNNHPSFDTIPQYQA